jgi:hypothetical protein
MNKPHSAENTPLLVERKPQAHTIEATLVRLDTNLSTPNRKGPLAPSEKRFYHPNPHSPGQPPLKNYPPCPRSPPQPWKRGRGWCKLPQLPLKERNPNRINLLTKTNLKEETQDDLMTLTGKDQELAHLTTVALETFSEAAEEGN